MRALFALLLTAPLLCNAQTTEIRLIEQQYTTHLTTTKSSWVCDDSGCSHVPTANVEHASGEAALAREIVPLPTYHYARATADTFAVSTATGAYGSQYPEPGTAYSTAMAESMLTFSTLADVTASLNFSFLAIDLAARFSEGMVSLFDITAGQSLFSYSWEYAFDGTVPWNCCYSATINETQELFGSHLYRLTLRAATDANTDSQAVYINLAGLSIAAPVPEPEAWALVLAGFGLVGVMARRRSGTT